MENFIVSARKYRPTNFNSVVGQGHITNTLKNAIKNNHLAQAFLFTGPRGVGKTTCARILAKTINCHNITETIEPCNVCESCVAFNHSGSFNIYELDAASNNSVDDIRALVEQVRYAPQGAKYKIYIIDEVHMLSQAAFNAFLKTLEEPPSYAIFILATTERHKILPTILSRCQVFDFNRIRVNDISQHLQGIADNETIEVEQDALHIIAQKADGALRDALSIFDQMVSFSGNSLTYQDVIANLNILDYDYYFKVVDCILAEDITSMLLLYNDIMDKGFDGQQFLSGLSSHFRNLLVSKDAATYKLLEVTETAMNRYKEQADKCDSDLLLNALNITNQFDLSFKGSRNQRLHVELALMKLCHIKAAISLASGEMPAVEVKKKPSVNPSKVEPIAPTPPPAATPAITASKVEEPEEEINKPEPSVEQPSDVQEESPAPVAARPETPKAEPPSPPPIIATNSGKVPPRIGSLKNLAANMPSQLKEEEKSAEGDDDRSVNTGEDQPITLELIQEKVLEYAGIMDNSNRKMMGTVFRAAKLELNGLELVVKVDGRHQKIQVEEERTELMIYIKQQLNNYSLSIDVILEDLPDEERKAYTQQEKFEAMARKNPNIQKMKDVFGFDFE